MVLIFQSSLGFGTVASGFGTVALAPTVSRCWFQYLQDFGSSSYCWTSGFWYKVFEGLTEFFSFWYEFGSISVPFQFQIRWNLKLWYWKLNWQKPKLLRIVRATIQKSRLFRYFQFWTNTTIKVTQSTSGLKCKMIKNLSTSFHILILLW